VSTPSCQRPFNIEILVSVGLNASCYSFARLLFAAFLPPMLEDGVAFSAHPQNTVARFSLAAPHELRGFVIRGLGAIRVHLPTLLAATGVTLNIHPDCSIATETLDDVYALMYRTMFHNHLQQLVRVLGLHYNGKGWEVIRVRLRESIPPGHALERAWLGEEARTIPGKCFVRMQMVGTVDNVSFFIALVCDPPIPERIRDKLLHQPFPNLFHYTGVDEEARQVNQG
jgi:hypothetical protein